MGRGGGLEKNWGGGQKKSQQGGGLPKFISQYADDTSLISLSDDSIRASFEVYSLFEKASGSKLNQSKSKGLWLGGWCDHADPLAALDWSSVKIKVLGVFVGVGDLDEDNWRWTTFSNPGVLVPCPIVASLLSLMPWLFLESGMWPPLFTCPLGPERAVFLGVLLFLE